MYKQPTPHALAATSNYTDAVFVFDVSGYTTTYGTGRKFTIETAYPWFIVNSPSVTELSSISELQIVIFFSIIIALG